MAVNMHDAVYGCLVGGAIGDALGAPVEGWYVEDIRAKYGKLEEFFDYDCGYAGGAGHVTDDTYLRQLLCMAIVRQGGRVTPDEYARILREKMNPERLWVNEHLALAKIKQGMNPWWETGRGGIPAGCASMAIAPVGIINAGDPRQAYQDAFCIASVNQEGNNRDFAATFAAGIAAAFSSGATVDTVIGAMLEHADYLTHRALEMVVHLADSSGDVDGFVKGFYESALMDWGWPQENWTQERYFCGNSIELLPATVGLLKLCGADPNRCIVEGASFGRDCDTIASCCGQVVGALSGASALRTEWVSGVEHANEDVFEELHGSRSAGFAAMAGSLVGALETQRRRIGARHSALSVLLSTVHEPPEKKNGT